MRKRCLVYQCPSIVDEGYFQGELCFPCYEFVTKLSGEDSQAYRNSILILLRKLGELYGQSGNRSD